MLRKLFLIIFLIIGYIAIIKIDDKGSVIHFVKKNYENVSKKIKAMKIKVKINKWVYDKD